MASERLSPESTYYQSESPSTSSPHSRDLPLPSEHETVLRHETPSQSQDIYAQYALAQAINSLSYLMRNNSQALQGNAGLFPMEHHGLPWMPAIPPLDLPSRPYAYSSTDVNRHYKNIQEQDVSYQTSSHELHGNDIASLSPKRGRPKSRKHDLEPRRPKSAIRDSEVRRRDKGPRRSVSFSNPEIVSVDGKLYSPSRSYHSSGDDSVYDRFHDQHSYRTSGSGNDLRLARGMHSQQQTPENRRAQTPRLPRKDKATTSIDVIPDSDESYSDSIP